MINYFMENWNKCKSDDTTYKIDELKNLLEDEESKRVLETRIKVYETGDTSLLEDISTYNEQYFDKDIIKLSNNEFFIDLGAYTGDTIEKFIEQVNGSYKKIIAFEPDHENMLSLNSYILENDISNVVTYKLASWNKKETLRFYEDGSFISQIYSKGNSTTNANSLDNVLFDIAPVTFIKMDVEGAECQTIEGTEKIIKKYKPKLAICVYHRARDIYEIPLLIKSLVPEYKLYLRHYSESLLDTVLYATLE